MKTQSFQQFQNWLLQKKHLSGTTTRLYTTLVRGVLRDPKVGNELIQDPNRFYGYVREYEAGLASSSRSIFRTAMRSLLQYLAETRGLELAIEFPDGRKSSGRIQRREKPEHPLKAPLKALLDAHVSFGHLEHCAWGNVDRTGIYDAMHHVIYPVPVELLRELSLWAGGGERALPEQAIVPFEPKARHTMPAVRMLRIAHFP